MRASFTIILEKRLKEHVVSIVDGNDKLSGEKIRIDGSSVPIISISEFVDRRKTFEDDVVLLLTPAFSSQLVPCLDEVQGLDGIKSYLLPMILNKGNTDGFAIKNSEVSLIPRIIHYFWIGNNTIFDDYKRNIDGWKRLCPDYEIICWNEENYDFRSIPYMKEAFEMGGESLMYATDYARMDVLYKHGGIYMDTDVELVKPLDELLYNEAFIGIEENGQVNSGSAIGAMPGHAMIKKLMDSYDGEHFIDEEGRAKRTFNTYFETSFTRMYVL